MTAVLATRPLWAGRSMVLLGILLLAANLRTAVVAFSPIVSFVDDDIPLDVVGLGVLGMLPPIAFAASGIVAPWVARRIGLELSIAVACAAMVAGPLVRAVAGDYAVLLAGTVLALAGMGFGNILLPPAVKKYFPDRIGLVTSSYATLMALSTAIPPLIAAPVAGTAGWRASLALWGVIAAGALVPWIVVWLQSVAHARRIRESGDVLAVRGRFEGRIWRSRVAWAITLAFAIPGFNVYAMFAWLPELLRDTAGVDEVQAGALLGLFGLMGLPASLLVPILASRLRNVSVIIYAGLLFFLGGYAGLLLAPAAAPWLWVALAGSGPLMFQLCLALINLRTRSPEASVALSGFVQSIGYSAAAFGPLVVALLHDVSGGGWTVPLLLLAGSTLLSIVSAVTLARPRFVEDDLEGASDG
ncbi:MFS transporter [Salinibacterium soli]|uniref:MFS transporter n=1 Tax=Antiquaquibacter soli TaxID=3064523 RepID=A0ABT9BP86_9MICO|nr:MFS transporter [Protaetiibacter sp. WY-16]MDO7881606.1 MFS transporter [Protaetiibacter sp. WY-16]